jgi:hypothetical protein
MARGSRAPHVVAAMVVVSGFVACGGSETNSEPTADAAGGSAGSSGRGGSVSGRGGTSGASGGSVGSAGSGGSTGGTSGSSGSSGIGGAEPDASPDGSMGTAGTGGADAGPTTLIDRCPGPLTASVASALRAGGTPGASMKWLYPYDRTVFPRGILAPMLQWDGPAAQALYVHVKSAEVEYHGCFGPTDPLRIRLPEDVWTQLASNASSTRDPITAEITTSAGGQVSGPIKVTWTIAPAPLDTAIYYNTYGSPQAAGNGAIMRLVPGQARPQVYLTEPGIAPLGPCKSCHSLSANGGKMVLARSQYPAGPYESFSYDVGANPNPPPITTNTLDAAGFAGVYPDGSRYMTMGSPGQTVLIPFPTGPGNVPGMEGPRESRLFQIDGTPIVSAGWNVKFANMPMFSPDGTKIVFNHHDTGQGHSLAVMDFNAANNSFSNLVEIYRHNTLWPGWPTFTPSGHGVVFALGDAADYVSAHPARVSSALSDLHYVDLASKRWVRLSRAGGFEQDTSYLPYPGRDEHREFFPSIAPQTAGGYVWLFFMSRRNYGNTSVLAVDDVSSKHIWVAAIDVDPAPGTDPSHPAFFLEGQELGSGNYRPVAVPLP